MKFKITKRHIIRILKRISIAIAGLLILFFLLNWIFPLHDKIEYSTIITDNKGEVINAYLTSDQKWRMKTELKDISPLLRKTIIAKEDKYFYSHPGVNLFAVGRAFFKNIFTMRTTSGASTITMQVARALEHRKRNIGNKIIEMFRAFQLELKYSKNEILQMYLNLVPYGSNIEGVKSASILYFNKNPDHLSLAEITALSIIPNRPSTLVIGRNNNLIIQERNKWLKRFASEKVFTKKEIEDALAEPLTASRGTVPHYLPHLSYKLKQQGGDIIQSNIIMNTQLKTEKLVGDYVRTLRLKNIKNAAVVIIDNHSHQVVTYVGSSNFHDTTDGGQVNGAAAVREPGSTLKPLLYGLCIDEGLETPKMVVSDVEVNYAGYSPENYDKKFNGYVTVEYALEHSLNIPAVKSLKLLGKEKLIQKLAKCNFKQIRKDQNKLGLSMILGGCGATLEELTGLFSAFANEGVYVSPSYIQNDTILIKKKVISTAASYMITDILSRVNRPDFPLNWQATEHMPKIAWKTGTSYGRRDAWSIGYNKNYTVGVWVGNFSGIGVADLSGANVATPLLFKIFNTIDYDSDAEWFRPPADCEQRKVCGETGLIPTDHCSNVVMDYFIPMISSVKKCNNWQEITVSADEKISYCKNCVPETGFKKKWYKIIDPEMQAWFTENKMAYEKIPSHNPDCEKIFKEGAPDITSPASNTEYLINKKDREPLQLTCKTANDVSKVYWYINNKFYKASSAGEKQFFVPDEGPVKISCTDDKGRNKDIWITVRYVNL
ncbi:MAG TPA: penicillin-binding protein 1C [Chitinophagaceae bacterium]|nr:penicillin-binding protein 1C [Chitinophagaceae bacterium]